MKDEELINQFINGNEEAFDEIYRKYSSQILAFISRLIGNFHRAEEICQEVFIKVFTHMYKFDTSKKFSSWLFTIARNLSLNEIRNKKTHYEKSRNSKDADAYNQNPEVELRISNAIKTLSENHRSVFLLKHEEGLSYEEIAEVMNCSTGTVKSRMYFAIRYLRKTLGDL